MQTTLRTRVCPLLNPINRGILHPRSARSYSEGNTPQGPNKPASETTGTAEVDSPGGNATGPPKSDEGSSKNKRDSQEDARHPAKQPDGQAEPTRGTGIGSGGGAGKSGGEVSPKDETR